MVPSSPSVGPSSRRGRTTLNSSSKPFPFHDVIELDDEEDVIPRNNVIEISSDSEDEMDVDDMLVSSHAHRHGNFLVLSDRIQI